MGIYHNLSKKQRPIFILLGIVLFFGIVYFVSIYTMRIGKIGTVIQFAPRNTKITLNGVNVKNNSTKWLEPGKYEVVAECNHFQTEKLILEINKDNKYIVGTLSAADKEGEEYTSSHSQEFTNVEGLIGRILSEEGINLQAKYPILKYLPINNSLYSISYTYDGKNRPIVNIKTTPEFIDDTVAKMNSFKNADLINYQIDYQLENPFINYQESAKSDPEETIKSSFNLTNYKLSQGKTINDNYYVASIYTYDYNRDLTYGHYRILLKKQDDSWHIVAAPQPFFTKYNTPNTADDILNSANSTEL